MLILTLYVHIAIHFFFHHYQTFPCSVGNPNTTALESKTDQSNLLFKLREMQEISIYKYKWWKGNLTFKNLLIYSFSVSGKGKGECFFVLKVSEVLFLKRAGKPFP